MPTSSGALGEPSSSLIERFLHAERDTTASRIAADPCLAAILEWAVSEDDYEMERVPPHIALYIRSVVSNTASRDAVVRLKGRQAQDMVSIMQLWLSTFTIQDDCRRRVISVLLKLSIASGALPEDLFIRGVHIGDDRDPWASGGYADVFKGTYRDQDVAIKRFRIFSEDKAKINVMLCREALLWRQLNHPHILPFLGVDSETFAARHPLCLISPWMSNGTLKHYINSSSYNAPRDRIRILLEVSRGIDYLHRQHVVHGDINWVNVFVDDRGSALVADFGLARISEITTGNLTATASGPKGTVAWMSPERLGASLRLMSPTDVYSFGMLCYVMWTRTRPFSELNDYRLVMHVSGGGRPRRPLLEECHGDPFPDALWELATRCWTQDARCRPDMANVVSLFARWFRFPEDTCSMTSLDELERSADSRSKVMAVSHLLVPDLSDASLCTDLDDSPISPITLENEESSRSRMSLLHPLLDTQINIPALHLDLSSVTFGPEYRDKCGGLFSVVDELEEPATTPGTYSMIITNDMIPQWPIILGVIEGSSLSVQDVLNAIWRDLQVPVSSSEWDSARADHKDAVESLRSRRGATTLRSERLLKRVDFLLDKCMLQGLRRVGSSEHWRLILSSSFDVEHANTDTTHPTTPERRAVSETPLISTVSGRPRRRSSAPPPDTATETSRLSPALLDPSQAASISRKRERLYDEPELDHTPRPDMNLDATNRDGPPPKKKPCFPKPRSPDRFWSTVLL